MKTAFFLLLLATLPLPTTAEDSARSKQDMQALRTDLTRLQTRLTRLEGFLRAKGILPPPKYEKPDAWMTLEIRIDASGQTLLSGKPATSDEIRERIAAVIHSGKFPDIRLTAAPSVTFARVQEVMGSLDEAGALNISLSAPQE